MRAGRDEGNGREGSFFFRRERPVRGVDGAVPMAVFAAAGLVYASFILRSRFVVMGETWTTLVDDAMISMRYAAHLAEGHGLVWNVGEAPVEGFSNPLWTLLMALCHLLPVSDATRPGLVMFTSAALLLGNGAIVSRLAARASPRFVSAKVAATVLTLFCFPLAYWSLRGLEVGLVTTLVNASALLVMQVVERPDKREAPLLGAVWALMSLAVATRLDALLQVGVLIAFVTLFRPRLGLRLLTFVSFSVGMILLLQVSYFGDWLPNTYALKVVGVPPAARIKVGLETLLRNAGPELVLPLVISGLALLRYRELRCRPIGLMAALFFVQCAYSVWVGGDYAEVLVKAANRFVVQGMPCLFVVCGAATAKLLDEALARRCIPVHGALAGLFAGSFLLATGDGPLWIDYLSRNAPMLATDIDRAMRGFAIRESTDRDAVVAVHAAGNIPYYSERRTLDLLGKSDRVVARTLPKTEFRPGHDRWNYEHSIGSSRPDVVADDWGRLGEYMSSPGGREYERLACGVWVRRDSRLVDRERLCWWLTRLSPRFRMSSVRGF